MTEKVIINHSGSYRLQVEGGTVADTAYILVKKIYSPKKDETLGFAIKHKSLTEVITMLQRLADIIKDWEEPQ